MAHKPSFVPDRPSKFTGPVWDHYTKRQKSYTSDLRQMGANWREARLRGSIVPRPPLPMLSERIGGDNRPNFLAA
jgi:hypothetical protein